MIIACIRSGLYYIIEDDVVIAKVIRLYRRVGSQNWSDGYEVLWKWPQHIERFRTLQAIHEKHPMSNWPGYNAILKGQK